MPTTDLDVRNVSLTTNTPVHVQLDPGTERVVIQCRTAVDLKFSRTGSAVPFFTIKSGTVFELRNVGGNPNFWLTAASGVVAEIVAYR